jgi:hypothetical protein
LPQGELESLMWSQGISEASVAVQYSVIWNYISHNVFTFFQINTEAFVAVEEEPVQIEI